MRWDKGGCIISTLSNTESKALIDMLKHLLVKNVIIMPALGEKLRLDAEALSDSKITFNVDANRGRINPNRCSFQLRHRGDIILLRLDVDAGPHTNPDETKIECPHLHIYDEDYGTRYAYQVEVDEGFVESFRYFLERSNVQNIPGIQERID